MGAIRSVGVDRPHHRLLGVGEIDLGLRQSRCDGSDAWTDAWLISMSTRSKLTASDLIVSPRLFAEAKLLNGDAELARVIRVMRDGVGAQLHRPDNEQNDDECGDKIACIYT